MAISLYMGRMGSGKSYETVRSVIVPAIKQGRRIVTNVAGLKHDKIVEYLSKKYPDWDSESAGEIVRVKTADLLEQGSLPVYVEDEPAKPGSVVLPGDLLVIDEVWNIYPSGSHRAIPDDHKSFLRMHRHITREDGLACDIVLISQQKSDVNRFVTGVVELIVKTVKLKSAGMNNSYRVELFSGGHINPDRAEPDKINLHKYKPEIFELYSSYSGGSGKGVEVNTDERINILGSSKLIKYGIPAALLMMSFGGYYIYTFFTDNPLLAVAEENASGLTDSATGFPVNSSDALTTSPTSIPVNSKPKSSTSSSRLIATYTVSGVNIALAENTDSLYRYIVTPDEVSIVGRDVSVRDDGERYVPWSGGPSNSGL